MRGLPEPDVFESRHAMRRSVQIALEGGELGRELRFVPRQAGLEERKTDVGPLAVDGHIADPARRQVALPGL